MAKKELSLILRLKNDLQVGLAKAKASLSGFASGVASIGKWAGAAFLAAGASVAAFAAKAVMAYADAEKGANELRSSFTAFGEEVENNTAKISALAAAIQNETGVSGDSLVARAARLKMLGVETKQLGDAMKATVALASVGMEEEAATRAVQQALEGNYSALMKYIPALRTANTDAERAALVNDFLTRGYSQQAAKLDTIAGRWNLFKERVGDALEEVGRAIATSPAIIRLLAMASDKAKEFGETLAAWVDSAKFQAVQHSIEGIVNAIAKGGAARQSAVAAIGEYLKSALSRGAEIAGAYLLEVAPKIGSVIGASAKVAFGGIFKQVSIQAAAKDLGIDINPMQGAFGIMVGISDEQREQIKLRAYQLRQEEALQQIGISNVTIKDGETAAQVQLAHATAALLSIGQDYATGVQTTSQIATNAASNQISLNYKVAESAATAADEKLDAEIEAASAIKEVNEAAASDVSDVWTSTTEQIATDNAKAISGLAEASAGSIDELKSGGKAKAGGSIGSKVFRTQEEKSAAIGDLLKQRNSTAYRGAYASVFAQDLKRLEQANVMNAAPKLSAGSMPSMASTLGAMPDNSSDLQKILGELQGIRSDNQKLLTFG